MRYQPQGRVRIDRSHPLARGLVFAWVPASEPLLRSGNPARSATPSGAGIVTDGSAYLYQNAAPGFSLDECSLTAILTPANFDQSSVYAVGCGSSSNSTPLFLLGQGATARQLAFRTRDSGNADVVTAATSSAWQNQATALVSGTRSLTSGRQRLYLQGAELANSTVSAAAATSFDRLAIGGLLRSSFALGFSGTTSLVLVHNRALSAAEQMALASNPWQVFAAPEPDAEPLAAPDFGGTAPAASPTEAAASLATQVALSAATPSQVGATAALDTAVALSVPVAYAPAQASVALVTGLACAAASTSAAGAAATLVTQTILAADAATGTLAQAGLTQFQQLAAAAGEPWTAAAALSTQILLDAAAGAAAAGLAAAPQAALSTLIVLAASSRVQVAAGAALAVTADGVAAGVLFKLPAEERIYRERAEDRIYRAPAA
jgi:hypothetical protein